MHAKIGSFMEKMKKESCADTSFRLPLQIGNLGFEKKILAHRKSDITLSPKNLKPHM